MTVVQLRKAASKKTGARNWWRQVKGQLLFAAAAASLIAALLVVVILAVTTILESRRITAMGVTASAGLSFSIRTLEVKAGEGRSFFPYVSVAQADRGSSAYEAGLRRGDALLSVAGQSVGDSRDVWNGIASGDIALPDDGRASVTWLARSQAVFGELRALPVAGGLGQFRPQISFLPDDSPLAEQGLKVGDILVQIGSVPVTGTRQAWEALVVVSRMDDPPVPITVERDGDTVVVFIDAVRRGDIVLQQSFWRTLRSFLLSLNEPRYPERAGLASAIAGSLLVLLAMTVVAFPLGMGAAIYLEAYATKNWFTETIQILIANLAGIPSVVYGIFGLQIFARAMQLERSVLAGGLTLGLVILPIMIIAAREALRAVPPWVLEAGYGVGCTRWQVISRLLLPASLPGMLTGMILSIAQAIGESAPLILLGAFLYVNYVPSSLTDNFTVVPLQIFDWATRPQPGYETIAAAAIIVLMVILVFLNGLAIWMRNRYQRRW